MIAIGTFLLTGKFEVSSKAPGLHLRSPQQVTRDPMSPEVPMKRVTAVAVLLLSASAVSGCQTMTGRTAGQHFNDKWLLHETKGRIAAQIPRALTAMNVDVHRGNVYLIGTVATPEQKARAEEIARDVDGVVNVVNHLETESALSLPAASPPAGGSR
jgi:osmotically-inducible protein OsmY